MIFCCLNVTAMVYVEHDLLIDLKTTCIIAQFVTATRSVYVE